MNSVSDGLQPRQFFLGIQPLLPIMQARDRGSQDLHRALFRSGSSSAAVVIVAVAVQLLNAAAMYWCAKGLRVDLDFGAPAWRLECIISSCEQSIGRGSRLPFGTPWYRLVSSLLYSH